MGCCKFATLTWLDQQRSLLQTGEIKKPRNGSFQRRFWLVCVWVLAVWPWKPWLCDLWFSQKGFQQDLGTCTFHTGLCMGYVGIDSRKPSMQMSRPSKDSTVPKYCIWLVVWNMFYFSIQCGIIIPTDSYFSEWLKPLTRHVFVFFSFSGDLPCRHNTDIDLDL